MTFHFTHADTEIDSSVVYEAYYNKNTRDLAVVLHDGYGYQYSNVDKSTYDSLVNPANSAGAIYNSVVKHGYSGVVHLGYVGPESEDFVYAHPAPSMSNVTGPRQTVGTPKGLTYATGAKVDGGRVTLTTVPAGNTKRTFAVEFVSGGKVRTHNLDAESFGDAEKAVLEIGNMLDVEFEVKVVRVVE